MVNNGVMGLRGGRFGGVPVGRAPVADAPFSVSILGPLEVRANGATFEVTQPRLRQLLAILARRTGDGCTTQELFDQLWPDRLPANPRQALQIAVSRLRTALGPAADHLETRSEGYALTGVAVDAHVIADSIDAVIERSGACTDVRSVRSAADELGALLDSWHGEPLVDVPTTPMLDRWCSELSGIRDTAEHALVDMLLADHRHDEAALRARALLARDRTDESATRCLVIALTHGGHKAEALRVLDQLREALRTELGVDPSPSILALERDVLHGKIALEPVRPSNRARATFVARRAELDDLTDPRRPRLVVVRGPSGIGKSELLRNAAERLRSDGATVVACDVLPRATRPLEPVRAIVSQLAARDASSPSDVDIERWAAAPDEHSPPGSSRDECVELLAAYILNRCDPCGTHVLVDDAHWLDRTSAAVLERLVEAERFDITIAVRPDGHARWADLAGAQHTLDLAPFDDGAVLEFLDANHPRLARPDQALGLRRRSGGNPLLLSLLVDGLAEGVLSSPELPVNLLMAAAERLSSLPTDVQRTLEVAAAIGEDFDISLVAAARPEPYPDLRAAERAGLVRLDGGTGSFTHGVIAEAAHQLIAPVERIDLHDLLGTRLRDVGAPASIYAEHFDQAAELDPRRAARARLDAGREHLAVHDLDGAHASFSTALKHLERVTPDALTAEILLQLGVVERRLGEPGHGAHLRRAVEIARSKGADDVFFEAVVELCRHGASSRVGTDDSTVARLLTEALDAGPPPEFEAQLCAAAATVLSFAASTTRGRDLFRTAWTTAHASGDPELEAAVLMNTHLGLHDPDELIERERATERLRSLAGEDADRCWECAFLDFTHAMLRGDGASASDALSRMRHLHTEPKDQPRDFGMAFCESSWATIQGRFDDAEEHANRALAIGTKRYSASWAFATYGALVLAMRDAAGELGTLLAAVEQAVHEFPEQTNLHGALACVAALNGDERRARRELRFLVSDGRLDVLRDLTWTGATALAGRAAVIVGDERFAGIAADALRCSVDRMSFLGVATVGPIDEVLAEIARARGDADAARVHVAAAHRIVDRLGAHVYRDRLADLECRVGTCA